MLPKFLYVLQMVPILSGHDRGLENNCQINEDPDVTETGLESRTDGNEEKY